MALISTESVFSSLPGTDGQACRPRHRVVVPPRPGPGSGKSAVLARLVTMSNPRYRRGMPGRLAADDPVASLPAGAIDVAVHARTAPTDEVVSALAVAAGAPQADLTA